MEPSPKKLRGWKTTPVSRETSAEETPPGKESDRCGEKRRGSQPQSRPSTAPPLPQPRTEPKPYGSRTLQLEDHRCAVAPSVDLAKSGFLRPQKTEACEMSKDATTVKKGDWPRSFGCL